MYDTFYFIFIHNKKYFNMFESGASSQKYIVSFEKHQLQKDQMGTKASFSFTALL